MKTEFRQIVVSGPKIKEETARSICFWLGVKNIEFNSWINENGNIGFTESTAVSIKDIKKLMKEIGEKFLDLEVGVTYMSGPKGEYNIPKENFLLKNGILQCNVLNPHAGHPAPTGF